MDGARDEKEAGLASVGSAEPNEWKNGTTFEWKAISEDAERRKEKGTKGVPGEATKASGKEATEKRIAQEGKATDMV